MVSIVADDGDVERCLERILALSRRGGAVFSDDMTIRCRAGDFAIEAPVRRAGEVLARLPRDRLVPIMPFRFSIESDDLRIAAMDPGQPRERVELMEAMLALYNLAGKMARHRRTSPWSLVAAHPQILPAIEPRLAGADLRMLAALARSGNGHDLMLNSFLLTRVYGDRASDAQAPALVLMPVIDALNHHIGGQPYVNETVGGRDYLSIRRSGPLPGAGAECFACYGPLDGFDSWTTYGFVDEAVPFMRSMAMTIDLPEAGRIVVDGARRPPVPGTVPAALTDIRFHVPRILARRPREITVSSLLIPGPGAPAALRRVLGHLVAELRPERRGGADLVVRAEAQIVSANRSFYVELRRSLQALALRVSAQRPIRDAFAGLCDRQLGHLERHERRVRDMPGTG